MGGGPSKPTVAAGGGGGETKYVEFEVEPVGGVLEGLPEKVTLRLAAEAVEFRDKDGVVLRSWPYFRIMCWGHGKATFHFRVFYGERGEGGASETISVMTRQYMILEGAIMEMVKQLMAKMEARGLTPEEMDAIESTIEEDADSAIDLVRQLALTRQFDAKQGVKVLRAIGSASPFDKIEAAVALYPALMHHESLALILEEFPDQGERDNICHRLKLNYEEVMKNRDVESSKRTKRRN